MIHPSSDDLQADKEYNGSMETSASAESSPTKPPKKRRWLKRFIWITLLSPFLFILVSNAWLLSPWGRSWIGGKIKRITSMETSVARAWWIPGGKFHLSGIVIQQPEELRIKINHPLVAIQKITLQPKWKQIIRGNRDFFSCEVDAPDVVLSPDLMKQLLASKNTDAPPAPDAPAIVAAPPQIAPDPPAATQPPPAIVAQNPPQTPSDTTESTATTPPAAPPNPFTPPAPSPEVTTAPAPPESWLFVRNGRIRIVRANSGKCLLDINGLNTDVPLDGALAKGNLSFDLLEIYHQKIYDKTEIPLERKNNIFAIGPKKLELDGLPYEFQVQVANNEGMPFAFLLQQLPTAWTKYEIFQTPRVQSLIRGVGQLTQPKTWQAETIIQAAKPRVKLGSIQKDFHLLQARCILIGGILQCTDFRMIGDEISVLGNGYVMQNTNFLAVLRIIASPRDAAMIESLLSKASPETPQILPPFGNPDRLGNDFFFGGSLFHTWVSLDQGKNLLDLRKVFAAIKPNIQSFLNTTP